MIRTIMSHPRARQAGMLGALAAALLLTPAAQADTKVGVTAAVNPQATGKPPSSQERVLYVGIDMQADERIRTQADGRVQLLFLDGSALSIGPNSDVVIDKYVYNPDNADNPGELAFRATKGVFRLIGGKISKVNPVVMHTSTASIGVRGSGALINAPEGGEKSTAIFMHGKDMFVQCEGGGCQGEKTVVTRPGSAIDFGLGLLSSPYFAKADLIKAIQGGFEKSGGLGEISPAAGPGGAGGGGTPDGVLATTTIANANSGAAGNSLVPPAAPPTNTNKVAETTQDAVSNSSNDTGSSAAAGAGQGNVTPPPPPPPLQPFTGSFTQGRFARTPVGSGFVNTTLAFTPDPANYTPIESAAFTNDNNSPNVAITLPNEVFNLSPFVTAGSFGWSTTSGNTLLNAGFGFLADDLSFFRLWGIDLPTLETARTFEVFGGVPTATFPTMGFATHQVLPLFGGDLGGNVVSAAFLPFTNTDLFASDPTVIVPFFVGEPNVTVSPLYSAYSTTIPVNGVAAATNARPVTFQASLAIMGVGADQSSFIMGQVGTYYKESPTSDVSLVGTAVGSYRPSATGASIRYITGATTQVTIDGNSSIYGPDAEFIVLGPDLVQRIGTTTPATTARQTSLGFAQPLDDLTGSSYFYQTTFQKVDPSQSISVGSTTVAASDLGVTRTAQTLSGYTAGIVDTLHTNATITSEVFQGPSLSPTDIPPDIQITTDPTTNRLIATFQLVGSDVSPTPVTLSFGSLTGFNGSSSAFIDDSHFAAADSPSTTASSTVGSYTVRPQLFMVTNAAVPVDPNSAYLSGVTLCTCQYMQWGWWTGETLHNDASDPSLNERDRVNLSTWVAGTLPAIGDLPTTGSATYNGHIIGNVVSNGASYLAAGAFSQAWNFANHTGALTITNFDTNKNFTGTTAATTGVNFGGTFAASNAAATGISGQLNGSFFRSPADPAAYQAGQFTMTGTNYAAGGTFAAQR